MSVDVLEERPISGKALAGFLVALVSLGLAMLNTRPVTETGFHITLLLGLLSVALAALALKDIWQGRVRKGNLLPVLAGPGMALLAAYAALSLRAMQQSDDRVMKVANDLKLLAITLREYEKANGTLPPAAVQGKEGQPLLSWRVLVLPYLEREGRAERGLFRQFRQDEPWDSPHNLPLSSRMPKVFAPPQGVKTPEPYGTYYRVFVGPGTAFEGPQGRKLQDFPDGAGKTILVVEAGEAAPWTKPEDLPYAADRPLPSLGFLSKYRFFAAFADGSLHAVRRKASEQSVRALITRNGGDDPGPHWEFFGVGFEDQ